MALFYLTLLIFAFTQAQLNPGSCPDASQGGSVDPPVLNDPLATLLLDVFTVNWIWSITDTRTPEPTVQFGTCAPTVPTVSTATGPCTLNQSASIDWTALTEDCGWEAPAPVNGILTYSGSIYINGTETFVDQRGNTQSRDLRYEFVLVVTFPESTTISSNIVAVSPVLVDYFIASQIFNRGVNQGVVTFQSSVQYPWELSLDAAVTVANSINTATVVAGPAFIADEQGEVSNQTWTLTITPGTQICVLNGIYTVTANLVCVLANTSECPALSSPSTYPLALAVTSENFCATTGLDVPVTGTLLVFSDAGLNDRQDVFERDAVSYYELTVESPSASITQISIDQVTLSSPTNVILDGVTPTNTLNVYSVGNWISPIQSDADLSDPTNNRGTQTFSFALNDDLVDIDQDQAIDLTVAARATITFQGNTKKRSVLTTFQVSTQKKSYDAKITYVQASSSALVAPSFFIMSLLSFIAALL